MTSVTRWSAAPPPASVTRLRGMSLRVPARGREREESASRRQASIPDHHLVDPQADRKQRRCSADVPAALAAARVSFRAGFSSSLARLRRARAAMGFYGTLKLIFFKVSVDGRIDQLIGAAVVGLVRDDEAFLRRKTSAARACARARKPLQISSDQMIGHRSDVCACRRELEQDLTMNQRSKQKCLF